MAETQKIDDPTAGESAPRMLGHYEVQDKIGQGGMAVVYKGVQPSLNRAVAIKVLPDQFAKTPELLGRFEREASIIAQLNHSNIVQVIDRGKEDDVLYIVMEFVDGEGLDQLIREKRLTTDKIIDYAMQICDGLEYAHSQGVVHRDLKPANIIIDSRSGRVKIADFGIAAIETTGGVLATLTYDNVAIGTMNYMSPEQRVDAHRVTHLTDIFSFGVILYEMLTGKLPIGHFKLPSLIRPDIPIGFDAIIRKCLSESPSDRYQSAGEIQRELARLSGRTSKLDSAGAAAWGRLNKKQRMYATLGIGAFAVLVIAAILVSVARKGRAPEEAPLPAAATGGPAQATPASPMEPTPATPAAPATSAALEEAKIQANFAHAQGLISSGKHREAISVLSDLVRQHPDSPLVSEFQFALARACYDAGEKEKCKTEFDRVIREYPDSPRVPEAKIGKCRAEWETAPRKKKLLGGYEYDAAFQQRLVDELVELIQSDEQADHVPAALQLLADVAQPEQLGNSPLAAEALSRLYALDPRTGPDSLYYAAELFDSKTGDPKKALPVYELFVKDFPGDPRADKARSRLEELRAALVEEPPEPAGEPDAEAEAPATAPVEAPAEGTADP